MLEVAHRCSLHGPPSPGLDELLEESLRQDAGAGEQGSEVLL